MGVRTDKGKTFCKKCSQELKMVVPDNIFNFCPHCGSPLNLLAFNLYNEREKILKLQTVNQVKNLVTDKSDLKNLLILIDKISKN